MRASLIILGIFLMVVGVLCYWSTAELEILGITVVDNPVAFLSRFKPYFYIPLVSGVISFLLGLLPKGQE